MALEFGQNHDDIHMELIIELSWIVMKHVHLCPMKYWFICKYIN